jgi:hypothetical protein
MTDEKLTDEQEETLEFARCQECGHVSVQAMIAGMAFEQMRELLQRITEKSPEARRAWEEAHEELYPELHEEVVQ